MLIDFFMNIIINFNNFIFNKYSTHTYKLVENCRETIYVIANAFEKKSNKETIDSHSLYSFKVEPKKLVLSLGVWALAFSLPKTFHVIVVLCPHLGIFCMLHFFFFFLHVFIFYTSREFCMEYIINISRNS